MLENKTQKKIIDYCNSLGYITVDLIKTNLNGIADLLVCTGDKKHFWVEVKQETGKMSEIQKYRQKQFESMGDVRITCYGYKDFINKYLEKIG